MTNLNFVMAVEVEVLRPRKARAQDDKFHFYTTFDKHAGDYS